MARSGSKLSRDYINRARKLLSDSQSCLEQGDYSLCIQRAAETVEFSVKAALNALGHAYEPQHDVTNELIRLHAEFPHWAAGHIARLAFASRLFTAITRFVKYGDEH